MPNLNDPKWWQHAVCYQVYIRSFADSDGDGLGDLGGITSRLPYLSELGVDAVWITPFYTSPQNDHGYDVADYCDVDPRFGTLADFDAMMATANALGIKVIVDLVPNHTSSEHEWFKAALASGPGSAERARYLFREGRGESGELPPNNWQSVFGGPAWTRVDDGEWYLHLFDATQPDLDWRNPEVGDLFEAVLRFWLDRGVDGFRIDVAHGLLKEAIAPRPGRQGGSRIHLRPGHDRHRLDGPARSGRRADVGPARGARRLPAVAQDPRRVRRRPDGRGRGLDADRRVDGQLRPARRAPAVVQLPLAARALVGRRPSPRSSAEPSPPSGWSARHRRGCSATTT